MRLPRYVTRAQMEAVSPGIYDALPVNVRDRISAEVTCSPANSQIFRASFNIIPRMVDDLFARLQYVDGTDWPQWKLVAAFQLVEVRIGHNSVRQAGEQIFATMPWPPEVRSLADALRFTDVAYASAQNDAPPEKRGCWRVESESPDRMVLVDDTPYSCHLNEGTVSGMCRAFPRQRPRYSILDPQKAKRNGGSTTRYEIRYEPA